MKKKIGIFYWMRVTVMIAILIAVVTIIYRLNTPRPTVASVILCPTRVSSISVIGQFAILQEDMKWFRLREGQREELDPIAVEKWFGAYCSVESQPVTHAPPSKPVVTFAYVSGAPETLQQGAEGVYVWRGRPVHSPQLEQAITALAELPLAKPPGAPSSDGL